MMRSGILGAALLGAAGLPAYAESDITLSGNAAFMTQYVVRGIHEFGGTSGRAARVRFVL